MSKSTTPRTIRVGIVGLGMGKYHAAAYQKVKNCKVTALCDSDPKRLEACAKEFSVAHTFQNAQEMFDSGLIDAVSIATPNATHCPLTLAALKAGLHVLCEKPLALCAREAQQMVDAAKKAKRKLAVHFNHRMGPQATTIARYAQQGLLGEVYFARAIWHRRRGIPRGAAGWFYQQQTAGGGCLIDLGVHILDQVLFALGFPKVLSVSGQTHNAFGKLDVPGQTMDVEDFVTAYLRCEKGLTIALEVSWASHHEHPEQVHIALYGSKAGIVRHQDNYQDAPVQIFRREDANLTTVKLDTLDSTPSVQQDFIAAIIDNRTPVCRGEHGLAAMQIIDAIYESSRTGKEVRPPRK
ncbi:MAG: Gfo/Idh/MocA family oxidoreductase [Phycisphaeraceae bacterium]|nr:Gfo/Idh/MocA family oxidoreductase [Phycisphaeraceae bacterium]